MCVESPVPKWKGWNAIAQNEDAPRAREAGYPTIIKGSLENDQVGFISEAGGVGANVTL
jgi:hypothetical protein